MSHSSPFAGRRIAAAALVTGLAVVGIIAFTRHDQPADATQQREPSLTLLHAERFAVDQPFVHLWRRDRLQVTTGWLLVLGGDAETFRPRQDYEPVLYVGNQTAERINAGASGRLVVLVPGDADLSKAEIFLGSKALPEELAQADIDAQVAAARARGVTPQPAETVAAVTAAGVGRYPTDFELRLRAIDLVEQHSPDEQDLIRGWRVPRIR
jgi:hypothetical protein